VLFGIGWQLHGRWVAYIASGLYVINPVVLVNGRRAVMEGSLLCFWLLPIFIAILIFQGRNHWRWWIALGLAGGLTLSSKHSGIVFMAAAFGWLIIREIQKRVEPPSRQERQVNTKRLDIFQSKMLNFILHLGMSGLITIGVFIALSPAQWNDPVARL